MAEAPQHQQSTPDPAGRRIALLPDGWGYEIWVRKIVDDETSWGTQTLDANVALNGADGTTAFYKVRDDMWWPVVTFPAGWYGPYKPVETTEPEPVTIPEDSYQELRETSEPAAQTFQYSDESISAKLEVPKVNPADLPEFMTFEEFQRRFPQIVGTTVQETPHEHLRPSEDAVQMFDTDIEPQHKRLKDVWEGKGDNSPEAYTTFNDPDDIMSGWSEEQMNEHADKLRRESDEALGVKPVTSDYPYTRMTSKFGEFGQSTGDDGNVVPVPPQASRYAEQVEDWHGKAKTGNHTL
jgi:hypothetical protein